MIRRSLATAICLVFVGLGLSCRSAPRYEIRSGPLAVLGAFDTEVTLLEKMLSGAQSRRIEGITFVSGRLAGQPVIIAWTGVGKVNAAMTATLLIEHYRPSRVIVTGIAGAVDPNLEPGDIVIATRTAHHDMGIVWPQGLEPGGVKNRLTGDDNPTFFPADPELLEAARHVADQMNFDAMTLKTTLRSPRVVLGTIVTGDSFVASKEKCAELEAKFGADAVEMEGAAVAQICWQRGIGCLVIRSMSDKANDSAVVDKQRFYELAARNSASLVQEIIEDLE